MNNFVLIHHLILFCVCKYLFVKYTQELSLNIFLRTYRQLYIIFKYNFMTI